MIMTKEKMIEIMKEVLEIQGYEGNWNYDEYMYGMYNGMEFMLSIAEERKPNYKKAPNEWAKDKSIKLEKVEQKNDD
jgi:hypothetical protein